MCILFCKHTQTYISMIFRGIPSLQVIFLLHTAGLDENTTLQLRSFSLEDGITTLSHQDP